jgi:hypothetical protein
MLLVPLVVALAVLIGLVARGHWAVAAIVLVVVAGSELWRRRGPQRRAGVVRRAWPWHDG